MADISTLNWILPQLDPAVVLDGPAASQTSSVADSNSSTLTKPVLLAFIQQLGCDLESLVELKLTWLAEIFTIYQSDVSLNPAAVTESAATENSILDDVFANLRVLFAATSPNASYFKQIKTVMRLVRFAMCA